MTSTLQPLVVQHFAQPPAGQMGTMPPCI